MRWKASCLAVFVAGVGPAVAAAQSLGELVLAARARDPAVAAASAVLGAAEERVAQSRAAFGPTVVLSSSETQTRYREAPALQLRPLASRQTNLQITQPVLRTALVPALDAAVAQREAASAALRQAEAESTVRMLEAVFDLLKARDVVALTQAQLLTAQEQWAAAKRSFEVGTASVVESRDAEGRADSLRAQLIAAEGDLELREGVIAELVGQTHPQLKSRGTVASTLPALGPEALDDWLRWAHEESPQVQSARRNLDTAEAEITRAWQAHAPSAEITINHGRSSDNGTVTSLFPRRGESSSIGITLTVPLFASGATQSRLREAVALRDKARADLEAALRTVSIGVRQHHNGARTASALARGLEAAERAQELAVRANTRGREVGIKSTSDVLDAQARLFEARRDLSRSRYDAWLSYLRLRAAAGRLSLADVDAADRALTSSNPNPSSTRAIRGNQR